MTRRRAQQRTTAENYGFFNRIISAGLVGSGPGTVGEEDAGGGDGGGESGGDKKEDKSDESGCTPKGLTQKDLDAYKACEGKYWGKTAGDCHAFNMAAQTNTEVDKAWCIKQGGTGTEPCLELAHSCLSTVVCQVFNYIYASGAFTKECGKYGEPVGNYIWFMSQFETSIYLGKAIAEAIKCIGAAKGSCWPNVEAVRAVYHAQIYKLLGEATKAWNEQREACGLPASPICIDYPFLSIAAMVARGDLPPTLSPAMAKAILDGFSKRGYKPQDSFANCSQKTSHTFGLQEAIVEMSLWTNPNGFGKELHTSRLSFLNQDNWVEAMSYGIASGFKLVDLDTAAKLSAISSVTLQKAKQGLVAGGVNDLANAQSMHQLYAPAMLPEGSPSYKLIPGCYTTCERQAQDSTRDEYMAAFNINVGWKGGPEACKSIAATNDSTVCAQVAQFIYEDRMKALYSAILLVAGAMTAHNAHYAMLWQAAHGTIPIDTNGKKTNALAQAAMQYGGAAEQSSGTSWLKVLLTVGVVGAAGYCAHKYWPKK